MYKSLIKASFNSNKEFVSDVIQVNENLSYVFNVTKINLPQLIKLDQIEEEVIEDWEKSKKIEKIRNQIKPIEKLI